MASKKQRAFLCPHCEKPATASVRGEAVWDGWEQGRDHPINPPVEWTLVQCENCWHPSVQVREDYGQGFDQDDPVVVYPAPRRISPSVPEPLRREWEEAEACFKAKAYAATAVMVRRTLEGTCEELGVKKRTLAQSLKELRKHGFIDGMLAEWADALRIAGNQGAHYTGVAVPREDAGDALAFAEALLDHVYVLRKRFEEFRQRLDR